MDKEHLFNSAENEEDKPAHPRFRRTLPPFGEEKNNEAEFNESKQNEAVAESPEKAMEESPEGSLSPEEEKNAENSPPDELQADPSAEKTATDAFADEPEIAPKMLTKQEYSSTVNTFDWIKSFLFSLTTVIFIFTLIFRGVTVNGGSMLPTLEDREYLIISDLLYTPKTGDIVVVQSPNYKNGTEPLIKRVIATSGQKVRINFNTWQVWVDEVELDEDYVFFEENTIMNYEDMIPNQNGEAEVVVEENCIFVMGDHRNDSLDSRSDSVGQIDERYIMGRVLIRVTPFNRFGKVK